MAQEYEYQFIAARSYQGLAIWVEIENHAPAGLNIATLTPKLLLGGDLAFISSAADDENVATTLGVMNLDAVVTYFPTQRGFFLRGGAGPSFLAYTVDDDYTGKYETSASGFNVLGGLGYAFWLGGQFNLTANLDVSRQWYGDTESDLVDLEIEDTTFWSLWVGFDWY